MIRLIELPLRKLRGIMCSFWAENREELVTVIVLLVVFLGIYLLTLFLIVRLT
jgi:hypothetical protein